VATGRADARLSTFIVQCSDERGSLIALEHWLPQCSKDYNLL
jgi:hypothetical protein